MDTTSTLLAWASGVGVAAAAFERFRTQRANARAMIAQEAAAEAKQEQAVKDQIIAGKDELWKIATEAGDAWKKRYDEAHAEFLVYRTSNHERAQEAQALVLKYTAENAELRNRTDMSPILEHQRTQTTINLKIIQALDQILLHFDNAKRRVKSVKSKSTKAKP